MRRMLILLTLVLTSRVFGDVPALLMPADEGGEAVVLSSIDVRVTIRGHLARTEYDLTFRNKLDRIVGGDFVFPIPPDGEVSALGLYFDGKLRRAAAVERVQAKTAYEEVVHRRVDPALAEWSNSRAFRMRVFPIPANGTKRVFIAADQELVASDYTLDLRFRQKLESVNVQIDSDGRPVSAEGIALAGNGTARMENAFLDGVIRVPSEAANAALMAWSESERTWYASMPLRPPATKSTVAPAANVVILWDASGSAVQQDRARLQQFLQGFVARQLAWASVSLVPFHVRVEEARPVSGAGLVRALDETPLAGATDLAAALEKLPTLVPDSATSRVIVVSDGIHSMGDSQRVADAAKSLAKMRRPLLVVNASPRANDGLLGMLAASTGGLYLDLSRLSASEGVDRSMRMTSRVVTSPEVVPRDITTSSADMTAAWRGPNRVASFVVTTEDGGRNETAVREVGGAAVDLVRRAWARARLREMTERGASSAEITDHGRTFGMLTPRTSLIVLESWSDYEMYGIPMPDDVAEQKRLDLMQRPAPPSSVPVYSGPAGWFIRGTVTDSSGAPLPGVTVILEVDGAARTASVSDAFGRYWLAAAVAPASFIVRADLPGFSPATRSFPEEAPSGGTVDIALHYAAIAETITVTAEAPVYDNADGLDAVVPAASVKPPLRAVVLDDLLSRAANEMGTAPLERRHEIIRDVLARMKSFRSPAERFRYYATARAVAGGEKSFHIDAAILLRDDDPELALRVLTDLAEADANDAPLVRIIARIAEGWGHPDVARRLLQNAMEVSPKEPQTWRELILLTAREGRREEFRSLVARHRAIARDLRMSEVDDQIALEVGRGAGSSSDLRIDGAAAVQVELMFESNYAYVDLHVVEPSGEEVAWDHISSVHGGRHTGGMTEGFGPQIYVSPGGVKGDYRIDVRYYSSDEAEVSVETIAHLIVYSKGRFGAMRRTDHVVVLARNEERRNVTTVRVE